MLSLLPTILRARRRPDLTDAILIALKPNTDDHLLLSLRRGGREDLVADVPLTQTGVAVCRRQVERYRLRDIVLRLAPGLLLERDIVLPAAAERDPARVLRYEMDRLTPFRSDEVYWGWAAGARDRQNARITVRLFLIPKETVSLVVDALSRLGAAPTVLEAPDAAGTIRPIALTAADERKVKWRRSALTALSSACVLLAVVATGLPFLLQTLAENDVQARIAALRPRVEKVEALRGEIANQSGGQNAIEAERARTGDALQVVATVTDILPDSTFLTEFTLHQGKLGLSGQSAGAAQLIAALAADPTIRNPAFTAPVTRIGNGQADTFSLRAELPP